MSNKAESNFSKFLREMSETPEALAAYERDPEYHMMAAGLTEEEQALLKSGDEVRIVRALGLEPSTTPRIRLWVRPIT